MILIDKSTVQEPLNIILTLSDVSAEQSFKLTIHSKWDNKSYVVDLAENISPYPSRYDSFNCDSTVFNQLGAGRYNYKVSEAISEKVVETGILTVIDSAPTDDYVFLPQTEASDDYISY